MKKMAVLLLALLLTLTTPACAASKPAAEATGGSISIVSAAEQAVFSDIPASAWYADAVRYVSEHGWMNGTGDGKFSPDTAFTRAQLATVLYRIAGQPDVTGADSFTDTESNSWYSGAVLWAERSGVIRGIGGDLFGTNDPTTQEQLVTMLRRMEGEPEAESASDASAYAAQAVGWARATSMAPMAAEYTFTPKARATRAQIAAVLQGYLLSRENDAMSEISLTINALPVLVAWESNSSAEALRELLQGGPLTVQMSMYGGFEQVGSLGTNLPRSDVQTTTGAGDIVLYSGSNIVIFYGSNSWAYTRLGKIQGMSAQELSALLGSGDVSVTLAIR